MDSSPNVIYRYINFQWGRILGMYVIFVIPSFVGLCVWEWKKEKKRKERRGKRSHIEMI